MEECKKDCVHFGWDGFNPDYFGNCKYCDRNPDHRDWYAKKEEKDEEIT